MNNKRIIGLIAGASILGLLAVPAAGRIAAQAAAEAEATAAREAVPPSQPWAHDKSDVPVDAALRVGTLANGLRYAVMRNATPPGQASVWLRIDAGSLNEGDDQLGLAHFMEHMAFNGTREIPKNELIHKLERLGLQFGADLNAATGYDQTFYRLDMPSIDDTKLDTALHVLRQQVSEATMDPDAIDAERGVVEGEERMRNSPAVKVGLEQLKVIAGGTRLPLRNPIGDMEIIRTAPRERFVNFYRTYYRPSRATVIAVGDFDVDAMEARIKAHFADWQPAAPDAGPIDLGRPVPPAKDVHLYVDPALMPTISLSWTRPSQSKADSLAKRRENWTEELAIAVLQRRLVEDSRRDDPPFVNAKASADDMMQLLRIEGISATYFPGQWEKALNAVEQAVRQFTEFGVSKAELDREIAAQRTQLEEAVRSAPTRNTVRLAARIENDVHEQEVTTTPQTDLDIFSEAVASTSLADVNAAAKRLFTGPGPVVMLNATAPVEGGEETLAKAFAHSKTIEVAAREDAAIKPWLYSSFGKPGKVVAASGPDALGITTYSFANGVQLSVKKVDFDKNSVSVALLTGIGERNFSPDQIDPRAAGIGTLFTGGLGKMTVDEISRAMTGRMISGGIGTLGQRFMVSGGTRPEDLDLEMQYLAAFMTDPAYRSASFANMVASAPAGWSLANASPVGAFGIKVKPILAGGDQRVASAPPEISATWTMDPMRDDIRRMIGQGPIHVVIVGDIDPAAAVKATAATFGALPRRPDYNAPAPGADQRRFPAPNAEPAVFTHEGLPHQALGTVTWPTVDVTGPQRKARQLSVLRAVLNLRALDVLREEEALTYSPQVGEEQSPDYAGYGTISVSANTAPEKLPAFYAAVGRIVSDLQTNPITQDELERARLPMVEQLKRSMNGNGWWFRQALAKAYRASTVDEALSVEADYMSVTPAMIQAMAREYLDMEKAYKASVVADPKASRP